MEGQPKVGGRRWKVSPRSVKGGGRSAQGRWKATEGQPKVGGRRRKVSPRSVEGQGRFESESDPAGDVGREQADDEEGAIELRGAIVQDRAEQQSRDVPVHECARNSALAE